MRAVSISSNGTSAPPETSSASCQAASSTKAASESCSARLCMRREFAAARGDPPAGAHAGIAVSAPDGMLAAATGLRGGDGERDLGRLAQVPAAPSHSVP